MDIRTKADVKRIPPGTRLRCVRNLRGEVPAAEGGRIFVGPRGKYVVLAIDAPGTKYHGQETEVPIGAHYAVEARPGGFAVLTPTMGPGSEMAVGAEYAFDPEARCGAACRMDPGATCELAPGHDGSHKTYLPALGAWHYFSADPVRP